jgi:hypothetical protein
MKDFQTHSFDLAACRQEVLELKLLLDGSANLQERKHIQPFFRARKHLSAWLGSRSPKIAWPDRLATEYDLFGDFACDVAVGDSVNKAYCFIEFEDAGPKSLFVKQGKKATREWSPRFDHGYSQIIDWFYKLEDRRNSDEHEARFGARSIHYMGVLVVGRDQYMNAGERLRLEWRRQHVIVHSRNIRCVTYDELQQDLLFALDRNTKGPQGGG